MWKNGGKTIMGDGGVAQCTLNSTHVGLCTIKFPDPNKLGTLPKVINFFIERGWWCFMRLLLLQENFSCCKIKWWTENIIIHKVIDFNYSYYNAKNIRKMCCVLSRAEVNMVNLFHDFINFLLVFVVWTILRTV